MLTSDPNIIKETLDKERELIISAKVDKKNFAFLYNKYYEAIFRYIYFRVDDEVITQDLTSQVFLKALLNIDNYKFQGFSFGAWLYRIAINEIYDTYKKNSKCRIISIESNDDIYKIFEEIEEEKNDKNYSKLLEILSELEEKDLQLIEMRFFEKRNYNEIGEILGIKENNTRIKIFRILEKLRVKLKMISIS